MSHFGEGLVSQNRPTKEWAPICKQVGMLVNEWSGRNDLVAYVSETAGRGQAAALFDPKMALVEVNTKAAFGGLKGTSVSDLTTRWGQFDHPKAAGAIFHEAMHAKFSNWDFSISEKALTQAQAQALMLLEEGRIEALGALDQPQNRIFLRSSALSIALADMDEEHIKMMTATRQAATAAGLALARVDAGVLEESDVDMIREYILEFIPEEKLEKLRAIWVEFQKVQFASRNLNRMHDLAIEWDRLVQETAEENGEPSYQDMMDAISEAMKGESGEGEPGEDGDGEGESQEGDGDGQEGDGESKSGDGKDVGDGEGENAQKAAANAKKAAQAIQKAMGEDTSNSEIDASEEAGKQRQSERWKKKTEEATAAKREQDAHKETSKKVFGSGTGPVNASTNSRLMKKRKPKDTERGAAVKVSRELEKAKYRDRSRTEIHSEAPPGRLRMRAAVQEAAYRANDQRSEAQPWRRIQRKHTDEPDLSVGVMVDISGSMGGAMEPLASAAWVLSEAVRRIQGKVGMVYYGNDVFSVLNPGQHLTEVNVYSAADGTEKFDRGFQALDGALELLNGDGARLLVICSDGYYTPNEVRAVEKWLKRCQQAGVGVLWIGFGDGRYAEQASEYCAKTNAEHIYCSGDVTDAALKIGQAAAKALTAAGANR